MESVGHLLWSLLQDRKYVGTDEDGKSFDYWNELPAQRRQQYEDAGRALLELGHEQKAIRKL